MLCVVKGPDPDTQALHTRCFRNSVVYKRECMGTMCLFRFFFLLVFVYPPTDEQNEA